jgi:RHS repeat-associated protein
MGRRVKTILPRPDETSENPVQEIIYNEVGQVEFQIDPLGHALYFEYDEQGRIVRQTDANNNVTIFSYNEERKLLSLTDTVGNTTRYEYDEFDRMIKETNELGKSRLFEYLPSGLLSEKTDRNKRTTCFKYNRFGQILEEHWLDGKRTINQIYFEYDKTGHLTKVNDTNSSFEYDYDSLGRQNSETITIDGLNENILLRNTFNVTGHRVTQTAFVGQREDYTNHWTYDSLDHVTKISHERPSPSPKIVEYSYNLSGQRTEVKAGNVYQLSLSYDSMGQLAGMDYKNPANETLAKYGLTWDSAGRIVAINLDGEPAQYGYDVTNQLISATYKNLPSESYQYDANGNRKNFKTGRNNQLTHDGIFRYTYDEEGNRTAKISKTSRTDYFWDHRNRLVKVVADGKMIKYVYDYQNRLVKRNDEFFVHDGWQIVLTLDSKTNVKEQFLWGAKQDELLCENDTWVLCDHLGTVRKIVDENEKVVSHLDYNAFGKLLNVSGTIPRFRYTGKMFDDRTGLQWNINRWYDPKVGRWISEDTIGFNGKEYNLYKYARNFMVVYVDTLGLIWHIFRNSSSKAIAINSGNDTLADLAEIIGLDIDDVLKWITADGTYKIVLGNWKSKEKKIEEIGKDEKWCPEQWVEVPNTIFSSFFSSDIPGALEKFDNDNKFLKSQKLVVKVYNNTLLAQSIRKETFLSMLQQYYNNKELWGMHISGHGGPRVNPTPENAIFGARSDEGGPLIQYNELGLSYKLAVFYGFTCFSILVNQ